ncbi:MAG: enterochelin esterase-like enzyme [Chthonomonadales bacterium]|nr:enterochelin esterase-like enzyme [Chthonomonadales bacterium]
MSSMFRLSGFLAAMVFLALTTVVLGAPQQDKTDSLLDKAYPDAPIAELAKLVRRHGVGAFEEFSAAHKGKFPIITARKDGLVDVTFVYKAKSQVLSVTVLGPSFGPNANRMQRLPTTDVWYLTLPAPADAQFRYAFLLESMPPDTPGLDPLLRHSVLEMEGDPLNPPPDARRSLVKLPGAPPETYSTRRTSVPKGKLETGTITSRILKEARTFTVYTPAGWNGQPPANLLLVFDGEAYGSAAQPIIPTPIVLDNLLADHKIGPTVAIMVNNMGRRNRDLTCSKPFATFLAEELVPWVKQHYTISADPSRTGVAGSSLGGLCSAYVALQYPRVVGSVLSQSGSYWFYPDYETAVFPARLEQSLIQSYFDSPRLPIQLYMEVGTLEGDAMVQTNRRLRDILRLKGYSVTYREYSDAHDYQTWHESLADGLIALLGARK